MYKSLLPLFFALCLSLTALAQFPGRGRVLVGGSLGDLSFSTDNSVLRSLSVAGTPQIGIMLTRNLAVGLGVPLLVSSTRTTGLTAVAFDFRTRQIGLTPFARYYVGPNRLRPYLTASAGQSWMRRTITSSLPGDEENQKADFFYYSGGLGLAYFVNRHVSLDLTAVYNGGDEPSFTSSGSGLVGFNIPQPRTVSVQFGFQIFL